MASDKSRRPVAGASRGLPVTVRRPLPGFRPGSVHQEIRKKLLEIDGGVRVLGVQDERPQAALRQRDRGARLGCFDLIKARGIEVDGPTWLEHRLLPADHGPGAKEPVLGILAALESLVVGAFEIVF
jgi:hypothetical protein